MTSSTLLSSKLLGPCLLGAGSEPADTYDGELDIQLGHPGACPKEKVVYFNLFDNSGSMTGGNDPIGNRFEEVRCALHHLARHCRCGRELTAVVHFDTPTSGDVRPTKLDRKGLAELESGLAVPIDGAGISVLGPSLRLVIDMAARQPDYLPVVTVLSDFELFDPPDVLADLVGFPGVVHAVVFRSQSPTALLDDPDVLVTQVLPTDPSGAVAQAIFTSMTTLRRSPRQGRMTRKKEALTW